jgi:hypothetical protein
MDITPFNAQNEHLMHEREIAKAGMGAHVQEIRRQQRRERLANLRRRALSLLTFSKGAGGRAPAPARSSALSGPRSS